MSESKVVKKKVARKKSAKKKSAKKKVARREPARSTREITRVPRFLEGIEVTPRDRTARAPVTRGWLELHAWIVKHRTRLTAEDYGRLILRELNTDKPRPAIIFERLKRAFDKVRREEENVQLMKLMS